MEAAQSSKFTLLDCLTAVPDNVTVRQVITLAKERQIISNLLSPEACQLAVNNLNLQQNGAIGKLSEKYESIEFMEYEARKGELKGTGAAPATPTTFNAITAAREGSSAGSPSGLQISMVSKTTGWSKPWVDTRFKFFVSDEKNKLAVISDYNMVSNLSTESFEG